MMKASVNYEKVFARYTDENPFLYLINLVIRGKEKCIGVSDDNDWENAMKMWTFR
jgi:hypothetical protein